MDRASGQVACLCHGAESLSGTCCMIGAWPVVNLTLRSIFCNDSNACSSFLLAIQKHQIPPFTNVRGKLSAHTSIVQQASRGRKAAQRGTTLVEEGEVKRCALVCSNALTKT